MSENLNNQLDSEEKEIKYLKKFHKTIKSFKIYYFNSCSFIVVSVGRKTIILYSIDHKYRRNCKNFF